MTPHFLSPDELRAWLEANHNTATELLVGLYKKGSGKERMTLAQAVEQALCFGWIDGRARSLGPDSWMIRLTPRKPRSNWSAVNIERMGRLIEAGLVHPAGLAAFNARTESNSRRYSYENKPTQLPPALEARFRANPQAWSFFQSQPPGYRRTALYWVLDAKREQTQLRRLDKLIADSSNHRRLDLLNPNRPAPSPES